MIKKLSMLKICILHKIRVFLIIKAESVPHTHTQKERKRKMKRKLISLLLLCSMLLSVFAFTSCGKDPKPEEGTVSRMTVDINPSVEFMIDDQNKVISVTALNDDGSILIVGESFIGKTPEEATELVFSLASTLPSTR